MKIAISGKGGVGKTTVAAAFAMILAERGQRVLAVDADPDANLASALGIARADQKCIVTIAADRNLIEERTGASEGFGGMFRMNPEVSDIADRYSISHRGVDLLVLGAVKGGGSGCACAGSALLRALVRSLVLHRGEALILDMEAGIEHMGRSVADGVDCLLAVVEPGERSLATARRLSEMAADIGIKNISIIINGTRKTDDEAGIRSRLEGMDILGSIPFSENIRDGDREGVAVLDVLDAETRMYFERILDRLAQKVLDR